MSTNRKPSGSKTSKGRTDSTEVRREARGRDEKPPRAHRTDTGEAKQQREGMPKTHPTRVPVASRKGPVGRKDQNVGTSGGTRGARGR
jgi:hypothetical protein